MRENLVDVDDVDNRSTNRKDKQVADWGNVRVVPSRPDLSFGNVESVVAEMLDLRIAPITIGGDGSVSLPQLRALKRYHNKFAVIHFDAHTDSHPTSDYELHANATTFSQAVEEGIIEPKLTTHVGVRGTSHRSNVLQECRKRGFEVVTTDQLCSIGVENFARELSARLARYPIYLCWDMDVFDPGVAPGVVTPEWGGISAREGITLVRKLGALNLAVCDVNTVSPLHDIGGITGLLAARMVLELSHALTRAR